MVNSNPGDFHNLYDLRMAVESRAVSFENPTGQKGRGAVSSSPLGEGRKGSPARMIDPGVTVELADLQGPGVIRHMWITTYDVVDTMRGLLLRCYWDRQDHPSVEAPLGDFFGFAHGKTEPFQSAVHAVGEKLALNTWIPMPFREHARITLRNELEHPIVLFYQIDFTINEELPESVGCLHAHFRRENPTTRGRDFELLPQRRGTGRYLGTVIGVRPSESNWWGEGEVRIFLDGDERFPTIVSTGTEDYVGLSWGLQQNSFQYCGANCVTKDDRLDTGPVSIYRWHLPDPIYWQKDIRISVQQIGLNPPVSSIDGYFHSLYDRADDWCACSFWYEPIPSEPLPPMVDVASRLADLDLIDDFSALPLQRGGTDV